MSHIEVARIISSEDDRIITKILLINFPTEEDLRALFTPNLANIGFVFFGNSISVNLKNPNFREYFNEWVERFLLKITNTDSREMLIDKFNYEIKGLVLLGQKGKKLSKSAALGLYGELLFLDSKIKKNNIPKFKILEGWHRPSPTIHDFDYEEHSVEIKAITRSKTTIKINSEDQLTAIDQKELMLKLYRIDDVEKSKEDSLGLLYDKIKYELGPSLSIIFEIKCAEDIYCEYLGPEHMPLDYKFTIIEEAFFIVQQNDFPRIKKDKIQPGISQISYNIDISSIENFKIIQ